MQLTVKAHQQHHVMDFEPGANLLDVLRNHGVRVHAPCGGKGNCQKCQVEITGIGKVLSCQTRLDQNLWDLAGLQPGQALHVILPELDFAQISTEGLLPESAFLPLVGKETIRLQKPTLTDQRADEDRLVMETGFSVPFRLLHELPQVLRDTDYQPSFYYCSDPLGGHGEILRFVRPDSPDPLGLAVDIGTTTLAAYLYDLGSGERLGQASAENPQSAYGADVISRIEAVMDFPEKLPVLKASIGQAIARLSERLIQEANAAKDRQLAVRDICHYVLAGNTTMMHFLTGISPGTLARSPFYPASISEQTLLAGELGLPVAADAVCQLLPSVSGYVGADIIAGILACGLNQPAKLPAERKTYLFLDIGTNGEIVLAGPHGIYSCSAAAGPAFEGASISCGTGGILGAIDDVTLQDNDLIITAIGGDTARKACGICGSGLIAAVASLLDAGLIDETGRITADQNRLPASLQSRLIQHLGQPAVVIANASQSATGRPVILTQKDIREVQNAKAAIAAGIAVLIDQAGIQVEKIDQAYIAGGFGSYINVQKAFRIGLLPPELQGKTSTVGNAAGMGACLCLLDQTVLAEARMTARTVEYFELSADRRFVDYFVEAMLFPSGDQVAKQKSELRALMIDRRERLTKEKNAEDSARIQMHLLELLRQISKNFPMNLGVYSAIRNEPDLSGAFTALLALPARLYFPAVRGEGNAADLTFGCLPDAQKPEDFLVPGRFGIAEPPASAWLRELPALDIILVPGLAFDQHGSRLGWGKAFYDRCLADLPGQPVRIGICHSFQVASDRLPTSNFDQRVDWLLTPDGYMKVHPE